MCGKTGFSNSFLCKNRAACAKRKIMAQSRRRRKESGFVRMFRQRSARCIETPLKGTQRLAYGQILAKHPGRRQSVAGWRRAFANVKEFPGIRRSAAQVKALHPHNSQWKHQRAQRRADRSAAVLRRSAGPLIARARAPDGSGAAEALLRGPQGASMEAEPGRHAQPGAEEALGRAARPTRRAICLRRIARQNLPAAFFRA